MTTPRSNPSAKELNKVLKDIQNGKTISTEELLKKYPDFHWSSIQYDKMGDTILHFAARLGRNDIIIFLLKSFQPVVIDCKNKDDKTALHEAAQFSKFETCRILLTNGANVNALKRGDWTPLMLACTKLNGSDDYKIVNLFLESGAFVNYTNKDGWTCLHLICREGDLRILELLLQYGLNLKIKTKNGRTCLHIAALHGHQKIVEKLLDLGVNINEKDNSSNTALHEAVLGGHVQICKTLIKRGADITIKNKSDYNLLHLASSQGCLHVLKFLIDDLKQDVKEVNKSGLTPLHCAAKNNHKDTFNFLIEKGANINCLDNFSRTPLNYMLPS